MLDSFYGGIDPVTDKPWILCPICFQTNDVTSAREGGRLSTTVTPGFLSDVCVTCASKEYLVAAAAMNC